MARESVWRRDQDPGGFYIHLVDPGFPDPPWPNERRIGPIPRKNDALAQAASDVAIGMIAANGIVGIFSEVESEKRADGDAEGKAVITPAQIMSAAADYQRDTAVSAATVAEAQKRAAETLLPESVTPDEMNELADEMLRRDPGINPASEH